MSLKKLSESDYVATGLVLEIATMVDPAAFAEWYDGTGRHAKLHKPDARTKYMRAKAVCVARDILRRVMNEKTGAIRKALEDDEVEGWRSLGVPIDIPELLRTVREKYDSSQSQSKP